MTAGAHPVAIVLGPDTLDKTSAPAEWAKTLAHELAYALLYENFKYRVLADLKTESTAFVVYKALTAIAGITASCQTIRNAPASIPRHLEVGDQEEVVA